MISEAQKRQAQKRGAKVRLISSAMPEPDPVVIALEKLSDKLDNIQPQSINVENNVDIERLVNQQNLFISGMMDTLRQIVTMKQPENDQKRIVDIEYEFGSEWERGQIVYKTAKSHVVWGDE